MSFSWRVFSLAKEPDHPEQNQDAWWVDPDRGTAAIADGVTSGIFSGQWAQILTRAAVADWPDPADPARFAAWLSEQRRRWSDQIDTTGLAWYQQAKLREGGFATLVWVRIAAAPNAAAGTAAFRLESLAIGDSCLFHIRGDEMLASFPKTASLEFDSSPLVLGSVDLHRDSQLQFDRLAAECQPGDLVVLCSDAVAAWALDCRERGQPVRWPDYWQMPAETWIDSIRALQSQGRMRYDDATLLLLRVGAAVEADSDDVVLESATDELPFLAPGAADQTSAAAPAGPVEVPPEEETYGLAAGHDAPPPRPTGPPPLPRSLGRKAPPAAAAEDWRDAVNAFSERWIRKVSEKLSRGADILQETKDAAIRKFQEKQRGKPPGGDPNKPADEDP